MPAPFDVETAGSSALATVDTAGNLVILGTLTSDGVMLQQVAQAPVPPPGHLILYTLDALTFQVVAPGGQTSGLKVSGSLVAQEFLAQPSATGNAALAVNVGSASAFDQLRILGSGQIEIGPGNAVRDVTLGRTGAGILGLTSTNLAVTTAGFGLQVKEGANAKQGTATLAAGSAVVATTSVTATSRIFLTSQADGGAPGWLRVSTRTVGTSFTITSSSGTDTSTVAYQIFEPA